MICMVQGEGNTYCALTAGELVQEKTFTHMSGCGDPLGVGHQREAHIPIQKAFIPPIETYSHMYKHYRHISECADLLCVLHSERSTLKRDTHIHLKKTYIPLQETC